MQPYPTKMEANGNIYEINTDYRVALACLRAINDEEISDLTRYLAIEGLLLGTNVKHEDREILKDKISIYLRCGKEENTSNDEIDFDYLQDEEAVEMSIRQAYNGLDLSRIEYMHWWEYNKLISGLLPDSLINRIRESRTLDENDYKDSKTKEKIRKIKEANKIKKHYKPRTFTEEEQKNMEAFFNS